MLATADKMLATVLNSGGTVSAAHRVCLKAMPPRLLPQSLCSPSTIHQPISRHLSSLPPPPPPPKAFARLSSRRLILLSGPDSPHFLQGLTTRNIPPSIPPPESGPFSGFYSAFLNASGRVLHDVFIYPHAPAAYKPDAGDVPRFIIEVDEKEVWRLATHLKRYKLRAKVAVDVMDNREVGVWSAWNEESEPEVSSQILLAKNVHGCWLDERAEGMGARLLTASQKRPWIEGEEVTLETYNVRRMLKGVAEGQSEILYEAALPLESNMDYMGAIDFRKGCYVGQELTIRTHHTGVVRKRILPVQLYDSDQLPEKLTYDPKEELPLPPQGTDIKSVDRKGRSTGKWLGGVGNIGLALCRLENMTDITLTGDSNQWSPEHEFKMEWAPKKEQEGGEVKVRAFVPMWHRNKPNARDMHRDNKESG